MGGSNGARRLAAALWAAGACASAAAADPAELARGKELFTKIQPACAVCHTLQAAGAEGQVGPVLDELKRELPIRVFLPDDLVLSTSSMRA